MAEVALHRSGLQPTQAQYQLYRTRRKFAIPVFNRNQEIQITIATTEPNALPGVWCDIQKTGLRLREVSADVPKLLGVPIKHGLIVGLTLCLLVTVTTGLLVRSVWVAAILCMIAGLCCTLAGVALIRFGRVAWRLVLHKR